MFRREFGGRSLKEFGKYFREEKLEEFEDNFYTSNEFEFLENQIIGLEVTEGDEYFEEDISTYIYDFLEEEDPDFWVDRAKDQDPDFEGDEVEKYFGVEEIKEWVLEHPEFYNYILYEILRDINLERKRYKSQKIIKKYWEECRWDPVYKMCEKVQLRNLEIETGIRL